jgi:hypothetical protein
VVGRDPFYLLGREPKAGFRMSDLAATALAVVSEVPTPWYCLQHDLRLAAIDPASIRRSAARSMAENVALLRAGEVDGIHSSRLRSRQWMRASDTASTPPPAVARQRTPRSTPRETLSSAIRIPCCARSEEETRYRVLGVIGEVTAVFAVVPEATTPATAGVGGYFTSLAAMDGACLRILHTDQNRSYIYQPIPSQHRQKPMPDIHFICGRATPSASHGNNSRLCNPNRK